MVLPEESVDALRAYVEYLRDMGVYDLYVQATDGEPLELPPLASQSSAAPVKAATERALGDASRVLSTQPAVRRPIAPPASQGPFTPAASAPRPAPAMPPAPPVDDAPRYSFDDAPAARPAVSSPPRPPAPSPLEIVIPKPVSFDARAPLPAVRQSAAEKPAALVALQEHIGDCTRCPLAYAGRHKIVFADGDVNARLMFVGEGPGADEDASGVPFVGKAGQLLSNMINAMGLKREQVYIANIVKCRPPNNRTPEPVEANTCSEFLVQQIDIVQPQVIVALGATAATYLLGVKQSLASLRGTWHSARGVKVAVTYHPAFLLRDPRQKGEAWKDLQRVMAELGLKGAAKG